MATKRIELTDSGVIFDPTQHTYELNPWTDKKVFKMLLRKSLEA